MARGVTGRPRPSCGSHPLNLLRDADAIPCRARPPWPCRAEATVDQRGLVERARRGDHDAFAALVDAAPRAAGRGRPPDPPGPGARARRGPGGPHPSLARPAGSPRPRPVRRLAASTDSSTPVSTSCRRRKRRVIEVELIADRCRRRLATSRARSPTASCSTRPLPTCRPGIGRSSPCTTSWGCRCPRWRSSLGIPLGTAKSRLHYALAAMRTTVTAEPEPVPAAVVGGHLA